MKSLKICITGAGGFIGRQTVESARAAGYEVIAVVRNTATAPQFWDSDHGIKVVEVNLAGPDAADVLAKQLSGCVAIIHAAAIMSGPADRQVVETKAITGSVLSAMAACTPAPRLVLVSSLSVYDGKQLPPGAVLNEESPLESAPQSRDAYCWLKLQQEQQVRTAAKAAGFDLWVLRPGAVFGPGHLWNGHLGYPVGPVLLEMERRGEVPVSYVSHTAQVLVQAAATPADGVEVINVIDDDRPDRAGYIAALRKGGWPRFVVPVSWRLLDAFGRVLEKVPVVGTKLPGLLRSATLHARMKPLRFETTRLHEHFDIAKQKPFAELMTQSLPEGSKQ
ncbi:NAD-dependent epimerase/dehydratase family protein [Ruegeria profundi]|uniref:NAD-dependent epimerase/dehydratase family protein n=1 Tax=Ruegeria profundi TaxID=1685378 RepID=UPI003C7E571A